MNELDTRWQACPNEQVMVLHFRRELPRMGWLSEQTDEARHLRVILESQHGVEEVSSTFKYELQVKKGHLFSWDEIRPRIESALDAFFAGES